MAVLEVTIPTGYIVQQQKLDAYVRSRDVKNLQRARFLEQKVVFYFEYVCIFKISSLSITIAGDRISLNNKIVFLIL